MGVENTTEAFDFSVDFWSTTTPVADVTTKAAPTDIQVDDADAFTF
jgi:hypothetical protein